MKPFAMSKGLVFTLACVLGMGAACETRDPGEAQADVVFRVGDEVVRVGDMQAELDRMSAPTRAMMSSPEDKKRFLQRAIDTEVLAAEARRMGYEKDPEVVLATKRALVLRLLKDRAGPEPLAGGISDAEVERYYREHLSEFVHPEELRIVEIVVRQRDKAVAILREATDSQGAGPRSLPSRDDLEAFRALVAKYSEDEASKARHGELLIQVGTNADAPAALVQAASALQTPGELSGVIETPRGFHILALRQRVPGSARTLAESRSRIIRLLSERSRDRKLEELSKELSKKTHIEIFEDQWREVRFEQAEAFQQR
jgi:parvulin-like peptidyl-prolyl isomerase